MRRSRPSTLAADVGQKGTDRNAPILVRAYKKESELEIWKRGARRPIRAPQDLSRSAAGRASSARRRREGDRQVPEGFYTVTPGADEPELGLLSVASTSAIPTPRPRHGPHRRRHHGARRLLVARLLRHDRRADRRDLRRSPARPSPAASAAFQFQSYPFRMTAENMAKFRHDPNIAFWKNLKEGSDNFEVTKAEPRSLSAASATSSMRTPATRALHAWSIRPSRRRRAEDEQQVAELVAKRHAGGARGTRTAAASGVPATHGAAAGRRRGARSPCDRRGRGATRRREPPGALGASRSKSPSMRPTGSAEARSRRRAGLAASTGSAPIRAARPPPAGFRRATRLRSRSRPSAATPREADDLQEDRQACWRPAPGRAARLRKPRRRVMPHHAHVSCWLGRPCRGAATFCGLGVTLPHGLARRRPAYRRRSPYDAGAADQGRGPMRRCAALPRHDGSRGNDLPGISFACARVGAPCRKANSDVQANRPWQCLYFLPEPQGQGSLRPTWPQVAGSFGSRSSDRGRRRSLRRIAVGRPAPPTLPSPAGSHLVLAGDRVEVLGEHRRQAGSARARRGSWT